MGRWGTLIYILLPKSTKHLANTVAVQNAFWSLRFNVSKVVEFSAHCEPGRYLLFTLPLFFVSGACCNRCFTNKNPLWVPWASRSTRLERLGFFAAGREPTEPLCSVMVPLFGFCICSDRDFLRSEWHTFRCMVSKENLKDFYLVINWDLFF